MLDVFNHCTKTLIKDRRQIKIYFYNLEKINSN